jgi:hypothetical protein
MNYQCPDCGASVNSRHCVVCNASFKMCVNCMHTFPQHVCTHIDNSGKSEADKPPYILPPGGKSYWTGSDLVKYVKRMGCVFVSHECQGLDDYKNPTTGRHCWVETTDGDITIESANHIIQILSDY